jgi:Cdc6-like AAA superfamily ATPase
MSLQKVTDWLTPSDYSSKHRQNSALLHPGTGKWLIESADFDKMKTGMNQTLFCPGKSGAGKTILTSVVINHLSEYFENSKKTGLAYVYCEVVLQQVQTAEHLLGSLLKQLLQTCPRLPDRMDALFNTLKCENRQPNLKDAFQALQYTTKAYSKTFIIVDGLNECEPRERKKFLEKLFDLQKSSRVSIFATSRYDHEIESRFKHAVHLPINATREDISLYAKESVGKVSKFLDKESPEFKEIVVNTISDASDES